MLSSLRWNLGSDWPGYDQNQREVQGVLMGSYILYMLLGVTDLRLEGRYPGNDQTLQTSAVSDSSIYYSTSTSSGQYKSHSTFRFANLTNTALPKSD